MSAWHLFRCFHPLPCCSTIMLRASGLNPLGSFNRSVKPLIYGSNGLDNFLEIFLLDCKLQTYGS